MNELTDLEICKAISLVVAKEIRKPATGIFGDIKMDDLTICKKIAEIEGKSYWTHGTGEGVCINYIEGNRDSTVLYYNPLTDDALCFRLGFKFGVCIDYESGDVFIRGGDGFDGCLSVIKFEDGCFESLKRAICLAIIKSKE